jgi:hypothetical protein
MWLKPPLECVEEFFRILQLLRDVEDLTQRFSGALEVDAQREEICDAVLQLIHRVSGFLT